MLKCAYLFSYAQNRKLYCSYKLNTPAAKETKKKRPGAHEKFTKFAFSARRSRSPAHFIYVYISYLNFTSAQRTNGA